MSPAAPANEVERAALITQLICSAVNLDYSARRLQALREFSGTAKRRLNLLTQASDSFVAAAMVSFDGPDSDGINALSDAITQHQCLLLQCSPQQIQASLTHLTGMVQSNAVYIPALPAPAAPYGL